MNAERLQTLALNLRSIAHDLYSGAARAMDAEAVALASVVLEETARSIAMREALPPPAPPEPAKRVTGKRAPKGSGAHRHKFDGAGSCACGAKRQRAPKGGTAAAPPAGAASGVLPATGLPPGYRAPLRDADEFADGTMGSSGVVRR